MRHAHCPAISVHHHDAPPHVASWQMVPVSTVHGSVSPPSQTPAASKVVHPVQLPPRRSALGSHRSAQPTGSEQHDPAGSSSSGSHETPPMHASVSASPPPSTDVVSVWSVVSWLSTPASGDWASAPVRVSSGVSAASEGRTATSSTPPVSGGAGRSPRPPPPVSVRPSGERPGGSILLFTGSDEAHALRTQTRQSPPAVVGLSARRRGRAPSNEIQRDQREFNIDVPGRARACDTQRNRGVARLQRLGVCGGRVAIDSTRPRTQRHATLVFPFLDI
jgi:hypothetical protein